MPGWEGVGAGRRGGAVDETTAVSDWEGEAGTGGPCWEGQNAKE